MPINNDLVLMGRHLVSIFNEKASQGGELAKWNRECAVSCSILLDYLKAGPNEADKTLFLINLYEEKYKAAKPPVISNWCNKISEYLLSCESKFK